MLLLLHAKLKVSLSPASNGVEDSHAVSVEGEWGVGVGQSHGSCHSSHLSPEVGSWSSHPEVVNCKVWHVASDSCSHELSIWGLNLAAVRPDVLPWASVPKGYC
eukprot:3176370-Rhodomonas_salina.2